MEIEIEKQPKFENLKSEKLQNQQHQLTNDSRRNTFLRRIIDKRKKRSRKQWRKGESSKNEDYNKNTNAINNKNYINIENSLDIKVSINLPKNYSNATYELISLSLVKIKEKFKLQECNFNNNDLITNFSGSEKNVISAIDYFKKSINFIRCKKASFTINKNMILAKNLSFIVKDVLNDLEGNLFKTHLQTGDNDNNNGIFITYFENCPDLDSYKDDVFMKISSHLQCKIAHFEIDVTKYFSFMQSERWKKFENEKLVDTNSFSFHKNFNNDGQVLMFLTGKKSITSINKNQIEEFLSKNELKQQFIRISQDDVSFI